MAGPVPACSHLNPPVPVCRNKLDLIIVLTALPDLFVDVGPLASIFRLARIARMFKLVQVSRQAAPGAATVLDLAAHLAAMPAAARATWSFLQLTVILS